MSVDYYTGHSAYAITRTTAQRVHVQRINKRTRKPGKLLFCMETTTDAWAMARAYEGAKSRERAQLVQVSGCKCG
jgi:hypothetical protein